MTLPFFDFEKFRAGFEHHTESLAADESAPPIHPGELASLNRALRRLANKQAEVHQEDGDLEAMLALDDEDASLLQSFLAEEVLAGAAPPPTIDGREVKFDENDLFGWARSLFSWRRRKRHEWLAHPGDPVQIPDHARVAIVGDWGTGRYGAVPCARTIAGTTPAYDGVIHLGDVYYSGTPKEVQRHFLDVWPDVPTAIHRACNSNHEMYAGGFGYFDLTLPQFKQAASYFCLENGHVRILGLDTGYVEGDLAGAQAAWAAELVASAGHRHVILLSHHQPYSLREKNYTALTDRLRPLLDSGRIFAWYWGHEHRCVMFDPHPTWKLHGRCIGHSGYPYFRDKFKHDAAKVNSDGSCWYRETRDGSPAGFILDGENPHVADKASKYGPNGFAALELTPTAIVERILSADGAELWLAKLH